MATTPSANGSSISPMSEEPRCQDSASHITRSDEMSSTCDHPRNHSGSHANKYLFTKPPKDHPGPYFSFLAKVLGLPPVQYFNPLNRQPKFTPENVLKVHRSHKGCVEINPIRDLWTIRGDEPSDLFIFAEDLDPSVIETVGHGLGILPDMFQIHLQESSYLRRYITDCKKKRSIVPMPDVFGEPRWRITQVPRICASLRWFSIAAISGGGRKIRPEDPRSPYVEDVLQDSNEIFTDDGYEFTAVTNMDRQRRKLPTVSKYDWRACEERVTISVKVRKTTSNRDVVVLMDPLSRIQCVRASADETLSDIHFSHQREMVGKSTLKFRMSPRGPQPLDISSWLSPSGSLGSSPQSTYQDMQDWLRHWESRGVKTCPLNAIVRVVQADTMNLIDFLSTVTQEVYTILHGDGGLGSEGRYIEKWRHLLFWAQDELPKIAQSMGETAQYLKETDYQLGVPQESDTQLHSDISHALEELIGHIQDASNRVQATQDAINSEMALINSKKGIAEAESVKRLTELAFFFIPLTFAAAVFSIQTRELQTSPPSIWVFFLTATCLVALVYGFRLGRYPDEKRKWSSAVRRGYNSIAIFYRRNIASPTRRFATRLWWASKSRLQQLVDRTQELLRPSPDTPELSF